MDQQLQALGLIAEILGKANVAVPIVFGVVSAIGAMLKGITGTGPSPTELADLIKAQIDANDVNGHAEIDRLKAL